MFTGIGLEHKLHNRMFFMKYVLKAGHYTVQTCENDETCTSVCLTMTSLIITPLWTMYQATKLLCSKVLLKNWSGLGPSVVQLVNKADS